MAGLDLHAEWLETDGRGGFASGTVSGLRTRRCYALLLAATQPPAGRVVLVNGIEAWAEGNGGPVALTSQRYAPDLVHHDARPLIASFAAVPWPTWTLQLPDGTKLCHEVLVHRRTGATLLRWHRVAGQVACRLHVRLLLSGRDYHALHRENPAFRFGGAGRRRSCRGAAADPHGPAHPGAGRPRLRRPLRRRPGAAGRRLPPRHRLALADRPLRRGLASRPRQRSRRPRRGRFAVPRAAPRPPGRGRAGPHVEVADGDAPHTPGGCPFQAWSLGELLRAEALVTP